MNLCIFINDAIVNVIKNCLIDPKFLAQPFEKIVMKQSALKPYTISIYFPPFDWIPTISDEQFEAELIKRNIIIRQSKKTELNKLFLLKLMNLKSAGVNLYIPFRQ